MGITHRVSSRTAIALAVMAVLCILAYAPYINFPFLGDDYVQIRLGRDFGPPAAWPALAADALYRCRATSILLTYWTEQLFGTGVLPYNLTSLVLHILNTWLVFALGMWKPIGWRISTVAACFFAVYLGHQEAVVWYAALPELLVFTFGMASICAWIRGWHALSVIAFVIALFSKESAVAVTPLIAFIAWKDGELRRRAPWIATFAGLSVLYFLGAWSARNNHLHFNDGTFSLRGPFWIVIPYSTARMLFVWGFVSLIVLAIWKRKDWLPLLGIAAVWIVITLAPYSFLLYMPFVPSRHTYWASAGLALVIAAGVLTVRERFQAKPWIAATMAALIIVHHSAYLWTRKYDQFVERAAPTERLIEFMRNVDTPVRVLCFPYSLHVAEFALEIRLNRRDALRQGAHDGPLAVFDACAPPSQAD